MTIAIHYTIATLYMVLTVTIATLWFDTDYSYTMVLTVTIATLWFDTDYSYTMV